MMQIKSDLIESLFSDKCFRFNLEFGFGKWICDICFLQNKK
jgi:hypothetical protein